MACPTNQVRGISLAQKGDRQMEKNLRCTVCPWRGGWNDAEHAARVTPLELPEALMSIQEAYEDRQSAAAMFDQPHPPPCPTCGHHTTVVARRQSFHPAM